MERKLRPLSVMVRQLEEKRMLARAKMLKNVETFVVWI